MIETDIPNFVKTKVRLARLVGLSLELLNVAMDDPRAPAKTPRRGWPVLAVSEFLEILRLEKISDEAFQTEATAGRAAFLAMPFIRGEGRRRVKRSPLPTRKQAVAEALADMLAVQ